MFAEKDRSGPFLLLPPRCRPREVSRAWASRHSHAGPAGCGITRSYQPWPVMRATTSDLDVNVIDSRYLAARADGIIPIPRR